MLKKIYHHAKRIHHHAKRYLNFEYGAIGAVLLALIVAFINLKHGVFFALTSSLKQFVYTFFFGGIIIRLGERFAVEVKNKIWALILATLIPSMLAVAATYIIHTLKGTPETILSTLPTAILVLPSFFWLGWRKRKKTGG